MTRRALFAPFVLALGLTAVPAHAAPDADHPVQVVVSRSTYMPGDEELGATPTLHALAGQGATLTNADAFAAHSITSDVIVDPILRTRLFDSGITNFRNSVAIAGVERLAPGTYTFHCSVHADNMRGTLVVH